jgi:O-antigen/teichoic acid export membrane protein
MNLIRVLMTIVFPLITYPYASRILSTAGVGRASYVATIVSYFQLIASFGVNNYAIAEGAKIRDDKHKLNKFVSEVFFINLVCMLLAYALFAVVFFIPKFDGYQGLLLISCSSILLTTLGMEWLFELLEEYEYITIRSVVFQAIALVMLFVFVRDRDDVAWYVLLTVLSTTGYGLVTVFQSRKYVDFFEQKLCLKDLKRHLKPMLYMFGVSVASVIYLNSDITMLGWMKGDSDAGIYTISSKTNQILCTLIKSLSTVILPRLSYYVENDKKEEYQSLLQNAFRFMMMLIVPCMVGMLMISPEVVRLIGGEDFLSGATASRILAINLFFSPLNGFIAYQIFMPKKKEKIIFWATCGGAISNLIVNFFLIPKWSFDGAAIATVLAEALVMVICLILGRGMIPFRGMFCGVWKYVAAVIPMICFYFLLQTLSFPNYIVYMLVMIAIGVATYGGMLLLLREEMLIAECKNIVQKIRRR